MPSVTLHPPPPPISHATAPPPNPLPHLLHTPLGLAILEIQGSLNLPDFAGAGRGDGGRSGRDRGDGEDVGEMDNASRGGGGGGEVGKQPAAKPNHLIGRLEFPLLASATPNTAEDADASGHAGADVKEGPWMKKVWLYVGSNQRLAGEVRKLGRPVGVVRRKRGRRGGGEGDEDGDGNGEGEGGSKGVELEIVEVVRWKVFFGSRPEFV